MASRNDDGPMGKIAPEEKEMKNLEKFIVGFISWSGDALELGVLVYSCYWGMTILVKDDHNQFYGLIMLIAAVILARVIGISDKVALFWNHIKKEE